jgi:hypothetical protein
VVPISSIGSSIHGAAAVNCIPAYAIRSQEVTELFSKGMNITVLKVTSSLVGTTSSQFPEVCFRYDLDDTRRALVALVHELSAITTTDTNNNCSIRNIV